MTKFCFCSQIPRLVHVSNSCLKRVEYIKISHIYLSPYLLKKPLLHSHRYLFQSHHHFTQKGYEPEEKNVVLREQMFKQIDTRDKQTFVAAIDSYCQHDKSKRSHLEFIHAALRHMEEYGVEDDLETYKKLLDIFPKGRFIAQNALQREFMHFPKHQQCAIDLLDQMEHFGVIPDKEMQDMIYNIFGKYSYAHRKFARMAYWMPKFKNASPFPLPRPLPGDVTELARLAIERICVDLRTTVDTFHTKEIEESLDKTWIISGQSPEQKKLIEAHPKEQAVYVEGPFIVWLRRVSISYFVLKADPKLLPDDDRDIDDVSSIPIRMFNTKSVVKVPSVHEQEDGVIYACCASGTSSRDSLLSWIRFLQRFNPKLKDIAVLFKLKAPSTDIVALNQVREKIEAERTQALPDAVR